MSTVRLGRPESVYARLRPIDAVRLGFECSYSADLTAALKQAIPFQARRWNNDRKRWEVDPAYGPACADLAHQYLGLDVDVPVPLKQTVSVEPRLIRLEYLGRCKERETGEVTAMGWADGAWSVIVAEAVLRGWFESAAVSDPAAPVGRSTLYGVLTVRPDASTDEIRSAYRKLARSTHPDVNKESDAAERFIALKGAYDVLSNELTRRKYDLGLSFEQEFERNDTRKVRDWWQLSRNSYAPPLRCGWILAVGTQQLSGFVVSQLLGWEAITREDGKEMVSSWGTDAKHFEVRWVEP